MKLPQRIIVLTVLASLLAGAGAGVVSSILTSNSLENYATTLLGNRGFAALEPRKPNSNPADYAAAVRQVRDAQARSLALITSKSLDVTAPDKWIGSDDVSGLGVVVSADGWILTTKRELKTWQNPVAGAEVWVRGSRYAIERVVPDMLTDFVLVKLTAASGLSPVGFGASEDVWSGDMMFVLNNATEFVPSTLADSERIVLGGPQPAEHYVDSWLLATTNLERGPVLSMSGDLLAFVTTDGVTLPLHHGAGFVQEIIRTGVPSHAALGAYVIDLSTIYNVAPELRQGMNAGALVQAPAGKVAVPPQTPAAAANLLARDIITAVDGEAVTADVSLAELLATYNPNQTAKLSLLREGSPIEISVTLGDANTLLY